MFYYNVGISYYKFTPSSNNYYTPSFHTKLPSPLISSPSAHSEATQLYPTATVSTTYSTSSTTCPPPYPSLIHPSFSPRPIDSRFSGRCRPIFLLKDQSYPFVFLCWLVRGWFGWRFVWRTVRFVGVSDGIAVVAAVVLIELVVAVGWSWQCWPIFWRGGRWRWGRGFWGPSVLLNFHGWSRSSSISSLS